MIVAAALVDTDHLKIFYHHIYEYEKGLRRLVLCTMKSSERSVIERRLKENGIAFVIWPLSDSHINVFFGHFYCIEVLMRFHKTSLTQLSPEKDYILGIMLGYDRLLQCKRYLERTQGRTDDEREKDRFRNHAFHDSLPSHYS